MAPALTCPGLFVILMASIVYCENKQCQESTSDPGTRTLNKLLVNENPLRLQGASIVMPKLYRRLKRKSSGTTEN